MEGFWRDNGLSGVLPDDQEKDREIRDEWPVIDLKAAADDKFREKRLK